MKNLISLATLLTTLSSFASVGNRVTPNLFQCQDDNNTFVNYTTSSFVGKPTFNVTFEGSELKLPAFPAIARLASPVGTLVTVIDNRMVPVDGPSVRYTLVVPNITLKEMGEKEEYQSLLVKTTIANPFFRPTPGARSVENNEFKTVTCTAESVNF